MKKSILYTLLLLSFGAFAQDAPKAIAQTESQANEAAQVDMQYEAQVKMLSVLWQQQSAEYRALCYQAFNCARLQLDAELKSKSKLPRALITDLDETIIDNSYGEAKLIKENKTHNSKDWKTWANKSAATALPGAVEFLQYAKSKGVTIFYISNRDTSDLKSTLENIKRLNLPDADLNHMLFLAKISSKEDRRQAVMKTHKVIMLMGDNLNDFTSVFEKKNSDDRKAEVDKVKEEFGKRFIVLPNCTYGEWESAIYEYQKKLRPEQKQEMRMKKLIDYSPMEH